MPVYEFRCKKCAKSFELRETFTQHDKHRKHECPHCGSKSVAQVLAPTGVQTTRKA